MIALYTSGEFDIVESVDRAEELVLLHRGHDVCDISGQCAVKVRWLLEQLRSPAFAAKFHEHTNCHGLAEYVQGRSLKWRDTPKVLGVECIQPNVALPRELPLTYQFMNGSGKAVHSGVVLGRRGQEGPAYILDKLHSCSMRIEPYVNSVRDWVRMICPLSMVRLRRSSIEVVQSVRKAA